MEIIVLLLFIVAQSSFGGVSLSQSFAEDCPLDWLICKICIVNSSIIFIVSSCLVLGSWYAVSLSFLRGAWTGCFCWMAVANCSVVFLSTIAVQKPLATQPPVVARVPCPWEELLSGLTLRTYTVRSDDIEQPTDLGQCPVCLADSFCPGDVVRELHCRHSFHSACVEGWISKGGKGCPFRCPTPAAVGSPAIGAHHAPPLVPAREHEQESNPSC